jgi:hypothetical protein
MKNEMYWYGFLLTGDIKWAVWTQKLLSATSRSVGVVSLTLLNMVGLGYRSHTYL